MITIGNPAPDFTLPRDGDQTINLSALRPAKVVIYFYPKDDTSGCTLEAQEFTARMADFTKAGATVVGISKDSAKSHDKFCKKYGLSIALASDEHGTVCEDYGVWVEKSMYGKSYMGIERSTFLVDASGNIAQVWRKVSVKGHVDAVLAAVVAI